MDPATGESSPAPALLADNVASAVAVECLLLKKGEEQSQVVVKELVAASGHLPGTVRVEVSPNTVTLRQIVRFLRHVSGPYRFF